MTLTKEGHMGFEEPRPGRFSHIVSLYWAATRPAFFTTSLVACLLGIAIARHSGVGIDSYYAIVSVLLAFLVHAAVNVLNDYFDAEGTDAINVERVYPFTGGSRFIQNGLLTRQQTKYFGYGLFLIAICGGLWLTLQRGIGVFWIGLFGVLVGWAYSATPFKLNSRGWGECCVLLGFLGVVVGADFVQRQIFFWQPVIVGFPYALLVTSLLYINQFPDCKADAQSGKRHWVVRLTARQATVLYTVLWILAFAWLGVLLVINQLPVWAAVSALPIFASFYATGLLVRHAETPSKLRPAIEATLVSMIGHGVLLTLVLFMEAA